MGLRRARGRRHRAGCDQPDLDRRADPDRPRRVRRSSCSRRCSTGPMPAVPRQRFGVADVRDVADAHIAGDGHAGGGGQALPGARRRPDDELPGCGDRLLRDRLGAARGGCRPRRRRVRSRAAGHPQRPGEARSSASARARRTRRSSRRRRACATSGCCRGSPDDRFRGHRDGGERDRRRRGQGVDMHRSVGVLALALAVLLSGCTASGRPAPTPRASPTPVVTTARLEESVLARAALARASRMTTTRPSRCSGPSRRRRRWPSRRRCGGTRPTR